jgi:hypothetical protein
MTASPFLSTLDRLVGMAYADDLKTVSGTGLPADIIDVVKRPSDLWLDGERYQSHTQVSKPGGSASGPDNDL